MRSTAASLTLWREMFRRVRAMLVVSVVGFGIVGLVDFAQAAGITVTKASVKIDPKKLDAFAVAGTFTDPPSIADAITLEFGSFAQTIPLAQFVVKGSKLTFKAAKGVEGVAGMQLDLAKLTFRAKGTSASLVGFPNPAATRLAAAGDEACTMTGFAIKRKKGVVTALAFKKGGPQFACVLTDRPLVAPTTLLTNDPTEVRVQIRIPPDGDVDASSVKLQRVDPAGAPVGVPLTTLTDDGSLANGDDIAADGVYSAVQVFTESAPGIFGLQVVALAGGAAVASPIVELEVATPLTSEQFNAAVTGQQAAQDTWDTIAAELGDTLKARKAAVKKIKKLPGVAAAGISGDRDSIWIEYTSGAKGVLELHGHAEIGDVVAPATAAATRAAGRHVGIAAPELAASAPRAAGDRNDVANTSVLIWDAIGENPNVTAVRELFTQSTCPKFQVTYVPPAQATAASVDTFSAYGTIFIYAHGNFYGQADPVIVTNDKPSDLSAQQREMFKADGLVFVMRHGEERVGITPTKLKKLTYQRNAVVAFMSCLSAVPGNTARSDAFLSRGAGTYFGWTDITNIDEGSLAVRQLFEGLVANKRNTGDAYDAIPKKTVPNASTFVLLGKRDVAYSGDFRNGDFEEALSAWTPGGDARSVSSLGPFTPPQGSSMAIVSTGLGRTLVSGALFQNFCLPKNAGTLEFDWNFSSEEFKEYCGSSFQDRFKVEIVTDTAIHTIEDRAIDDLCATVDPTTLHFDKSAPPCTETSSNDCKVWSTGWRHAAVDISAIAAAEDGKGVTLTVAITDVGDSAYDTAVLFDDVRIVPKP